MSKSARTVTMSKRTFDIMYWMAYVGVILSVIFIFVLVLSLP